MCIRDRPYYYATIITLVKEDSPYANAQGVADLAGASCTSQLGTIWYDVCLPQIQDADIQAAQESAPAMLVALESGRVDLVVTDMPTGTAATVAYPDLKLLDLSLIHILLETGLGGRLDATNSIAHPLVTVITSISLDHTEYLGDTIAAIAGEKAGIIKEGVPVVYDASCPESAEVIRKKAEELHAPAYGITPKMYKISKTTKKHIDFCIDCGYYDCIELTISSVCLLYTSGAGRPFLAYQLSDQGQRQVCGDRDHETGNHAGRYGSGGQSG